jgi:A/G-specific adenine glycosylase
VLRLWEGLGYYRRARQLHAAAKTIVAEHGGCFPREEAAVRRLPGIGRYTAGAILSIGTGARQPILEANTIRVFSRLAALEGDPASSAGQKRLWSLAESTLPPREAGSFNQALMELGSELCTPKAPACGECPVSRHCRALAKNLQQAIPPPPRKTRYEDLAEVAVVVRRRGRVLLRQCQPDERWAGLWDFPRFPASQDVAAGVLSLTGVTIAAPRRITSLKHGVTRFRITLEVFEAQHVSSPRRSTHGTSPTRWVTLGELTELPLCVTGRRIAGRLAAVTRPADRPAALRRERSRPAAG